VYILFLGAPVVGALIYAAGFRWPSRAVRAIGATVALGGPVAAAVLVAISSD
jgi:hypothetical protein